MTTVDQVINRIKLWWQWRWFRRHQMKLRNIAAWAVNHHFYGGSHDKVSILRGSADKRIFEAMGGDT